MESSGGLEPLIPIIVWLAMAVIVTVLATRKGRNGFLWFVYGILLWPVALIHILIADSAVERDRKRALMEGKMPCPSCKQMIMQGAMKCPFCQTKLVKM